MRRSLGWQVLRMAATTDGRRQSRDARQVAAATLDSCVCCHASGDARSSCRGLLSRSARGPARHIETMDGRESGHKARAGTPLAGSGMAIRRPREDGRAATHGERMNMQDPDNNGASEKAEGRQEAGASADRRRTAGPGETRWSQASGDGLQRPVPQQPNELDDSASSQAAASPSMESIGKAAYHDAVHQRGHRQGSGDGRGLQRFRDARSPHG
jgi:hypothetical protein